MSKPENKPEIPQAIKDAVGDVARFTRLIEETKQHLTKLWLDMYPEEMWVMYSTKKGPVRFVLDRTRSATGQTAHYREGGEGYSRRIRRTEAWRACTPAKAIEIYMEQCRSRITAAKERRRKDKGLIATDREKLAYARMLWARHTPVGDEPV